MVRPLIVLAIALVLVLPAVSAEHTGPPGPSAFLGLLTLLPDIPCKELYLRNMSPAPDASIDCDRDPRHYGEHHTFTPPPERRTLLSEPIDLACAAGFRATLEFMIPDQPFDGRIGILDLTHGTVPVAQLTMLGPDRLYVGRSEGPFLPSDSLAVAPGEWHTLEVTMTGAGVHVRLDGAAARAFAPLSTSLPDRVAVTLEFPPQSTPPPLHARKLEVVPILEKPIDALDAPWSVFGHGSTSESVGLNTTFGHASAPSLEVRTVPSVPDNPPSLGAWTDLRMPACAFPGVFRAGASVWFYIPADEPWGNAQFALLQLGRGGANGYAPMVVRVGDSDGDRRFDVEQDRWGYGANATPGEIVRHATDREIPVGAWHHLRVEERPAGSVVDMAAIRAGPAGMWGSDLPLVLDVRLDGDLVGTFPYTRFPAQEVARPLYAHVGLTHVDQGELDWFHVYFDDLETHVDYAAPTCGSGLRKFRATETRMGFASAYVDAEAAIVSTTIDDGSGPRAASVGESLPVRFPGEGVFTVWQNITLDDGRVLSDACRVIVDASAPVTSPTLRSCFVDCEVWGPPVAGDDGWLRSEVLLGFEAYDAFAGVDLCHVAIDGGAGDTGYSSCPSYWLRDGMHEAEHHAVDEVGNAEPPRRATVRVDATPPELWHEISATAGSNGWLVSPAEVALLGHDATSGLRAGRPYVLDGATLAYAAPVRVGDGRHTFSRTWKDVAGNPANESFTLDVDATAPVSTALVTSGAIGEQGWHRSDVGIRISTSDATSGPDRVWWTLESRSDGESDRQHVMLTVTGDYVGNLSYQSADRAGNLGQPGALWLRLDKTAPTTIAIPDALPASTGWTHAAEVTLDLAATDATSGVAWTKAALDGDAAIATSRVRVAEEGEHTVTFWSKDAAGNVEATRSHALRIDSSPPSLTSEDLPAGGGYDRAGSVTLRAGDTGSGVDSLFWRLDNGSWGRMPGHELTIEIPGGSHRLEAYALDKAGRISARFDRTYRADATPPRTGTPAATLALAGERVLVDPDGRVEIAGTASDADSGVARVIVLLDGVEQAVEGVEAWSVSLRPSPGLHDLTFLVYDRVGWLTVEEWKLVTGVVV